eukprot:13387475-Alexandrium_andersonii.AAC.1
MARASERASQQPWLLARQEQRIGGLERAAARLRAPRTPLDPPLFVVRFGVCAENGAERTPRELRGPILR